MIYTYSRYYDGTLAQEPDENIIAVARNFPSQVSVRLFAYVWKDGDRVDALSTKYLGDPSAWWRIMDINPEITDPWNIPVGSVVRVPYA